MEQASLAIKHLLLRLRVLNRRLRMAVENQRRSAERFAHPGIATLCVTDDHVAALLADIELLTNETQEQLAVTRELSVLELEIERGLRNAASDKGVALPLDQLTQSLSLTPAETDAVLVCVAPELDRSYSRIFGYILDDLNRQQPSVELVCLLAAESSFERLELKRALGRYGRLRRTGILQSVGDSQLELRQEIRIAPEPLELLLGGSCDLRIFRDPDEVSTSGDQGLPPDVLPATVERLAESIRKQSVSVIGVWGPRSCGKEEVVNAIASSAHKPLRRFNIITGPAINESLQSISHAMRTAAALNAGLWIETDQLHDPELQLVQKALVDAIAGSSLPVFLTGAHPWRPPPVLQSRAYTELELTSPGFQIRKMLWSSTFPEAVEPQINKLAGRFRLTGTEMRAAAKLARTNADLNSNGHRTEMMDELEAACVTVTRRRSDHFARTIKPRRTADDLILPDDVHKQVIEIARFFRASTVVDEEWGFGRILSGGGIKVLFTGEPGTGKTLGAEVIAGIIGLPLLKVDLARVVSKWVGETEKNLDTVFREAEESHAVLFFDEADSLFGKRGEVQHGTDRYANLEVGFLLQRLEDYFGLVILASNLKDQIDAAFTRRFHVIVHFPLPRIAERRRMWQLAFPPDAPIDGTVDLDMLQQLDMTGAGIVSAARTAALLAADEDSPNISMSHVVRGVGRQFRREARILSPTSLGRHGALLNGAP